MAEYDIVITGGRVIDPETGRDGVYDVVGPVCETGDFLDKERELSLSEGDLLAVRSSANGEDLTALSGAGLYDSCVGVPAQDCARAIQFLRHKAGEFGIDPTKVALSGGSAGAIRSSAFSVAARVLKLFMKASLTAWFSACLRMTSKKDLPSFISISDLGPVRPILVPNPPFRTIRTV